MPHLKRLVTGLFLVFAISASLVSCAAESGIPSTVLPTKITIPSPSPVSELSPPTPIAPTPTIKLANPTDTPVATASTQPEKPDCRDIGGRIETGVLETDRIRVPLEYSVYLPGCYDQNLEEEYPVLYLFHGQGFTDDQWVHIGVTETADQLTSSGLVSPFLIVMPHDRLTDEETMNRFGEVFIEELLPSIESNYRIMQDRDFRAIGGLSRGAGWAVHLGVTNWELFSKIGAHSPAVLNSDPVKLGSYLDSIPADSHPDFFVDVGDRDRPEILESTTWLGDLLNNRGITHEWHLFSGFHDEDYWSSNLETYLLWYTRYWGS